MHAILRFTPSLSPETSAVSKPAPAVYKNLSATEEYNPPPPESTRYTRVLCRMRKGELLAGPVRIQVRLALRKSQRFFILRRVAKWALHPS